MTDAVKNKITASLKATGYPVAYRAFKNAQDMPFICWRIVYSNNFIADGIVYKEIDHVQIELYTASKNPDAERNVQNALAGYVWQKSEEFIESENAYQVIYEIEV